MRTDLSGNGQRVRLAVGAALIGPALVLAPVTAPAFAETGGAQPPLSSPQNPVPPTTGEATTPATQPQPAPGAPETKPARPMANKPLDASLAVVQHGKGKPGEAISLEYKVRSTTPTTGYQLTIRAPRQVKGWEWDVNNGWECTRKSAVTTCVYDGAPTAEPKPMNLQYFLPTSPGSYAFVAKLKTAAPDSDKGNNVATATFTVTGAKPQPAPAKPKTGTISGRIWNDANANGRQDKGEKGVKGAKLILTISDGSVAKRTTVTGADGRYRFAGLKPTRPNASAYGLILGSPDGTWRWTKRNVLPDTGDSDVETGAWADEGPYGKDLPKNAARGIVDRLELKANQTLIVDGGLVKRGGGKGETLPVTGPATQGLAAGGALLALGGIALTVLARRRRSTPAVS